MGIWTWLFGRRESDRDAAERASLRALGMPDPMITRELDFRRRRAEVYRSRARADDRAGEPEGAELACAACGCRMVKLAAARGQLLLASHEVAAGVGPAEECVECGRAWCARCYPRKPRGCPCGIGQEARRWDDGVVRHGSVRLVKVHYP